MDKNTLHLLEERINQLMKEVKRLSKENALLKNSEQTLIEQRSRLIEKNDIAKSKVESMIQRLRSLDRENYH